MNCSAGKASIAQFGTYDYQRNIATNSFIPAHTDAANFAVGVYMRGAGFRKFGTWVMGEGYAITHSSKCWCAKTSSALDGGLRGDKHGKT